MLFERFRKVRGHVCVHAVRGRIHHPAAGLSYGAVLIHIPQTWIVVGALVMIGVGVMSAVSHTKRRDPPAEAPPAPEA